VSGRFHQELLAISAEGGWVFWALVALAFGIAYTLISVARLILLPDAPLLGSAEWRRLLGGREPDPGSLGRLAAEAPRLPEVERQLFDRLERRLRFVFVLVGAAPLVGLLGTVTGMLATFGGLARATAQAPVDVISDGVSEALITTQTGLVIGVPAFIVCALLRGRCQRLRTRFAQVEAAVRLHGSRRDPALLTGPGAA
jgi:biopolymer transport protein ExbB